MDRWRILLNGRRATALLILCLAGGIVAPASALDINLLLPPDPHTPATPTPDEPVRVEKVTPEALTPTPEPDPSVAPPTPTPATPDPAPPPERDPDQLLRERLEIIRFEIFTPPPTPGLEDFSDARAPPTPGITIPDTPDPPPASDGAPVGVENDVPVLARALADPESPLSKAVRAATDGPFTWRRLDELIDAVTQTARDDGGWSLARAFAPEQELTGGTLRLVVAPVLLDAVTVEGARWSRPEALRRPFGKLIGAPIRLGRLEAAQGESNRHPFRQVTAALAPSETQGASRLVLTARERKPWTAFTGYETTHSRTSGAGRFNAGFMAVAPWRTEDILTAQYAVDSEFGHLDSASVVYQARLPVGRLTATGLWSRSDTRTQELFDQNSTDWMARLAYTLPLPAYRGWRHDLEVAGEWRRTAAESHFEGLVFSDKVAVAAPLSLGWRGQRPDRWGNWSLSLDAQTGIDWPLAHLTHEAYELQREASSPAWLTLGAHAQRDWFLPRDLIVRQRLWGQASPDRLSTAGQFFLGGNRSIRGYRESEVSGDGGVATSWEVFSPSFTRLLPPPPAPPTPPDADGSSEPRAPEAVDPWQWLRPLDCRLTVFGDAGWVYQSSPRPLWERRTTSLAGAGLGLRVAYGSRFSAQTEYAWRLRDTGVSEDDNIRGYWHLSLNAAF